MEKAPTFLSNWQPGGGRNKWLPYSVYHTIR